MWNLPRPVSCVSGTGRWIPNHWTSGKSPEESLKVGIELASYKREEGSVQRGPQNCVEIFQIEGLNVGSVSGNLL